MSSRKPGLNKSYALLFGLLFSSSVCATQNNSTVAGAVAFEVGQGWVSHYFDEANQNRWFTFGEMGGYSYCIEAVQGSASAIQLDPNVALYSDASGTTTLNVSGVPIASNDAAGDPHFIKGARACYIAQAPGTSTVVRSFKVNVPIAASSGDAGFVKIRVVNTTLSALCYAKTTYPPSGPAGQVVNVTGSTVTVSTRMLGNNVVSNPYTSGALAHSGATVYFVITTTGSYGETGRCLVAHNGSPGALQGYVYTEDGNSGGTFVRHDLKSR